MVNSAKQVKVFRDIELLSDQIDTIVDRLPKGSLSAQNHGGNVVTACDDAKALTRLILLENNPVQKLELLKALDSELTKIESIMDSIGRHSTSTKVRVVSLKQKTSITQQMFVIRTQVSAWTAKYRALVEQPDTCSVANSTTSAN